MNKILPLFAWAVFGTAFSQATGHRPNILFLFTDDHALKALSAYGGPLGKIAPTPHLDRIAREGMIFRHCLVSNSICAPSRAVILTGKHSHLNGQRLTRTPLTVRSDRLQALAKGWL